MTTCVSVESDADEGLSMTSFHSEPTSYRTRGSCLPVVSHGTQQHKTCITCKVYAAMWRGNERKSQTSNLYR